MKKKLYLCSLLCMLFSISLCGCFFAEPSATQNEKPVTCDFFAMDTYVKAVLNGYDAETAADAMQTEMLRLDSLLSLYRNDSETARLRGTTSAIVSEDVAALLGQSLRLHQETGGAFDITLFPVSSLWGFPHGPYRVPDRDTLAAALARTGMQAIHWDRAARCFRSDNPELTLDFGGIAKGYAAEQMARVLKERRIRHALLNLGGNIKAIGAKPDGSPWRVAIQHPDDANGYLGILSVSDLSVVTSGDYERFFEKDKARYHHILDPKTGAPARSGIRSATIVCSDCATADGLSTALFVMGSQAAVSFWKKDPARFQFILFTEDRTLYVSEGLLPLFETTLAVTPVR